MKKNKSTDSKKMTPAKKAAPVKGAAGLSATQKKLPPFIQKAIVAKKRGK